MLSRAFCEVFYELSENYASLGFEKIVEGMKCHTIEDIKSALKGAGFKKVVADHHGNKPWITVIAKK